MLAVSGGGRSTAGLTAISCSGTRITAKVAGGGSIALDTASGVLQVSDVPPVGNVRLTGSATRQASSVRYGGSATGTTGSVQVKC